uniref:OBG-type G domain-containing protein n=2 Tax=Attheya septentrionalis TaxID=420275 RepID=A0A7S2XR95_9STRA|mmetsp:Transcript_29398/g.53847  ORF Transcript_29398/g.53847 Transcript_29398/m.53847 type:complete len:621 (+) Transcript_29398:116-1978(+)
MRSSLKIASEKSCHCLQKHGNAQVASHRSLSSYHHGRNPTLKLSSPTSVRPNLNLVRERQQEVNSYFMKIQCRGLEILVTPGGNQQDKVKKEKQKLWETKKKHSSRHRKERGAATYKFVDRARVKIDGGEGGNGCVSHVQLRGGLAKKKPNGGHGGRGGHVILVAGPQEQSLQMSKHHFRGGAGEHGKSQEMHGGRGKNVIIRVPCGVIVRRILEPNQHYDPITQTVITDETDEEDDDKLDDVDDDEREEEDDVWDSSDSDDSSDEEEDDSDSNIKEEKDDSDSESSDGENDNDRDHDVNANDDGHARKGGTSAKARKNRLPSDYDEVVNKNIRGADGLYHYRAEPNENDEIIKNREGPAVWEREKVVLADLDTPGSYLVVANGGRGGTGNAVYASRQFVPNIIAKSAARAVGQLGETAFLELELKLIADLGLVGFPNAGKSSLLAAMSMAKPEIAPYPFTTLHPLVGCIQYRDDFRVIAADVPGLIDGASQGRGRGHDFLRHLERTKALLYIVDAASVDGRDPVEDLTILAQELASYGSGDMLTRPALVVANKLDLIPDPDQRESLLFDITLAAEEAGIDFHGDVLGISAGVTGEGLGPLSKAIREIVTQGEAERLISE